MQHIRGFTFGQRWRRTMPIIVLAAALVLVSFGTAYAERAPAPWCAVVSKTEESVYWDCQYRSFEECRPNVLAGDRGWCSPNPYYVQGSDPARTRKRRHSDGT